VWPGSPGLALYSPLVYRRGQERNHSPFQKANPAPFTGLDIRPAALERGQSSRSRRLRIARRMAHPFMAYWQ